MRGIIPGILGSLALVGMTGCIQSFQNVVSDPLAPVAQAVPPKAKINTRINLKSWKVSYQGPAGWGDYSTSDDPAVLSQVRAEIVRRLGESGAVRIVEQPEDADVTVDLTVQITSRPTTGALVMTYANYGLALLPSLLGAPMTWGNFTTVADFTLLNRQGQADGHLQNTEERAHIIGVYYGRRNLWQPFGPELKDMLDSLNGFLQQHHDALLKPAQG